MKSRTIVVATASIVALTADSFAQSRVGKVDWNDAAIVKAQSEGPLLGGGSGFESGGSDLLKSRLPVLAILPSELHKVFDSAGIKLESAGDGQDEQADLAKVSPSSMLLDDGNSYNIEYALVDKVIMTLTGTRLIGDLPEGATVDVVEDISLASPSDEVLESEIQYSRFGEVLYGVKLSCAEMSVISYCQSPEIIKQAADQSRLLFAGVNE